VLPIRPGIVLVLFLCTATLRAEPAAPLADPALIPVTPAEGSFPGYPDLWPSHHRGIMRLAAKNAGPVDLLLLGDSLTAGNSGEPLPDHLAVWNRYFGKYSALNFGIGGDKTQNVLWRIEHDELKGLAPRVLVLEVGVNNLFELSVPRTAIAAGVQACVEAIQSRLPQAEVIVVNVFPHEELPSHLARQRGEELRAAIRALDLDHRPHVHLLDFGDRFLSPDGTLKPGLFVADHLHLTTAGYEVYAQALAPLVVSLLGR
jgi:beta-glucosidase